MEFQFHSPRPVSNMENVVSPGEGRPSILTHMLPAYITEQTETTVQQTTEIPPALGTSYLPAYLPDLLYCLLTCFTAYLHALLLTYLII